MLCYHNIVISKIIYINNIHYNMYILHIITLIFNDTVTNMNSLITNKLLYHYTCYMYTIIYHIVYILIYYIYLISYYS